MSDSTIKVQFFGICTHMEPQSVVVPNETVAAWGRRVVLVNASQKQIDPHPELHGIAPHVALLQIAKSDLTSLDLPAEPWFPIVQTTPDFVIWELKGVTMTIGNAVETPTEERGLCIPHLADYVPLHQLPAAGPATYNRDPELAACYFDFPYGALYGLALPDGPAMGVLEVLVSEAPLLEVTSFLGDGIPPISIPLRAGAEISLSNAPWAPGDDKDADFLLHFLLCETFPKDAWYPLQAFQCDLVKTYNMPAPFQGLTGPGCSNSNYP